VDTRSYVLENTKEGQRARRSEHIARHFCKYEKKGNRKKNENKSSEDKEILNNEESWEEGWHIR
jgi:hypothetical protein